MTRRDVLLLGVTSAAAPFALLVPGRASWAAGSIENVGRGTIYIYAWGGEDGQQGIFALDPERMAWSKVADQSDSTSYDTYFRVSHDGRLLAFARRASKGSVDEVVGVSIRDLARDGAIRKLFAVGGNPIWSPDGKRLLIAVGKGRDPVTNLSRMEAWSVNADESEPRKLPVPETDQLDDWSPDGSWILTSSHRDKGVGYQIYRMRLDGTEARRLTATGKGAINIDGRISPDGRRIAYSRFGDNQSGVWVMDADGSNARRLFEATEAAIPGGPSWSPDGRKIAISVRARRRHEKGYLEEFDPKLIILDLAEGTPMKVDPPLTAGLGNPQWAPSWRA